MVLYYKLYQSNDFSEISAKDYLSSLVDQILQNFPNRSSVGIVADIAEFSIDSSKLQPLGLIINELLTNIMKYAFKGRSEGQIRISALLKGQRVALRIQDDGVGLPESIDFKNSTGFGLMLVESLTDQLRGDIKIERGGGTTILLEFEL